jgi:DNA-binding NtrC family response regulator
LAGLARPDRDEGVTIWRATKRRRSALRAIVWTKPTADFATLSSRSPVDIALVDYAMPRISGTQFVSAARERRPDLPVIYITGYAEPVGIAQEMNAMVLRKPYRSSDLLRAVKTSIEQRGQRLTAANVISIQPSVRAGMA